MNRKRVSFSPLDPTERNVKRQKLERGSRHDQPDTLYLQQAARDGQPFLVKRLIDLGSDPTSDDHRAIKEAAFYGHTEVVRVLSQYSDPGTSDNLPLRYACKGGNVEMVKVLLGCPGVNPCCQQGEPLRLASYFGHTGVVELLLADRRVKPAQLIFNGTPSKEVVELLLKYGYGRPALTWQGIVGLVC